MPTYDYACSACGARLEIFHSITEAPKRKCPKCGRMKLERRIGAGAAILFRGQGFYQTDYRSDAYRKAEKAERGEGAGGGDGKSGDTKTDTKATGGKGEAKPEPKPSEKGESKPAKGGSGKGGD